MTVSSTSTKNSYSGDGIVTVFAYTFKIFDDDDISVIIRADATGTETVQTKNTDYSVSGVGDAGGGNITFVTAPAVGETVVLIRQTAQTQTTDYTPNDPFPAESHEAALDKLTLIVQDVQEEVDRSVKLSRTNTMTSTEFTVGASDRADKVLAFDSSGELSVAQELGVYRGDWTSGTAFAVRDLVKDTTNNNIYICQNAHTSSGSLPLTTNANFSDWELIVDAATATTSATNAAASATAAAASETAAAASETAAAASETAAAASETAAATSETNAASSASSASTSATNAATSETNAATSETNAATSATSAASSATSASSSASTATTKASEASTSATNAATSASSASSSATAAATSASNAATSETNAATSATSAASSASSASTSATNAATSETNASTSETNAASSATSASSSATSAASSASAASTSETNAATSASNAATSETNAATSETNAATSETNAANSATSAASSASSASSAQTAAESARDEALAAADNFDDTYLGSKASDPTVDNDGDALTAGDLYFNTTSDQLKYYTGSSWEAIAPGIANVSEDTTPQLGGNLDLNNSDITGTGDINITGTVTADGLTVDGEARINTTSGKLTFVNDVGGWTQRMDAGDSSLYISSGVASPVKRIKAANNGDISFYADNGTTQSLFFDASTQRLGLGTTAPNKVLHLETSGETVQRMVASTTNLAGFYFGDSGNGSIGQLIYDNANDSMRFNTNGAERVRITSGGNVGIGTASPTAKLMVNGGSANYPIIVNSTDQYAGIAFADNTTSGNSNVAVYADGNALGFEAGNAERMRIDSSGNLLVGTTDTSPHNNTSGEGVMLAPDHIEAARDSASVALFNRMGTDGDIVLIKKSGATVGSISGTASGTTYNTTSDIRLKTDINPIADATDKLMAMNPVSHRWKADPDDDAVVGFIAQEMAEIVPEAVSKGNSEDDMWSMDYGRITPVLVAALQDAVNEIKTLKKRVAELEAK